MNTHSEDRKMDAKRSSIHTACRKFLSKLGGHALDPFLIQTLAEVASKDYNLKLEAPCEYTDINFLRRPEQETFDKVRAENRRRRRAKRKYEDRPNAESNQQEA